ncbi:hypothetical protein Q8A73_002944 [Channa argus]|nr:hypothetical protein Q8A73_002944 [Channa argus]
MPHMYLTESVTAVPLEKTPPVGFDVSMINFGDSPVSEEWKERLKQKLSQRTNVFSLTEWDVGLAKGVEHTIRLSDPRPFQQRSRRLTPADIEDVRKHLQELLCAGIIKESRSPYASPIVIVRKKNGTIRMCIDYRLLNGHGVSPDPAKIEAVTNWPQPIDLRTLKSFLGFCGYYRRFIANYASIVKPLTELTKGYAPTQKSRKHNNDPTKSYLRVSEPFGDRWDQSCTDAFHQIIYCLTHAPVLAFADPHRPYILHVDARLKGIGAVLYQEYPEGLRPVAFASRKLSQSEKRYPIHQLEFLSLKWAVVDKFHHYLYGAQFTVCTDNNPLTYVLTSAKLNAVGHRWLAALSTYDFDVRYRPDSDSSSDSEYCRPLRHYCTYSGNREQNTRSPVNPSVRLEEEVIVQAQSDESPGDWF